MSLFPGEPGEPGESGEPGKPAHGRAGGEGGVGGRGGAGGAGVPVGIGGVGGVGGAGGEGDTGTPLGLRNARLAAYLLIVVVLAFGLWRNEKTANKANDIAEKVEREAAIRIDESCVNSWLVREDIRDGIQKGAEASQAALLDAFRPFIDDPVTFEQFIEVYRSTLIDQFGRPGGAREQIPNPECDLDAARERLAEEDD